MTYKRASINKYISFSTLVVATLLVVGIAFVIASDGSWHDPSTSPPNNNVATPINVLNVGQQTKAARLTLNNGLNVSGRFGINRNPDYTLDVDGNVRIRGSSSNGIIFSDGSLIKEAPDECKASDDKYLTWESGTWNCRNI